MDLPEELLLDDLDQIRVIDEAKGLVAAHLGLVFSFYFLNSHELEFRVKLAQCIEEYLEMNKGHLLLQAMTDQKDYERILVKNRESGFLSEHVQLKTPPEKSFWYLATGAKNHEEANPYSLQVLALKERDKEETGYFVGSVPFAWLKEREKGSFQKWIHKWAEKINPFHGYAGLGIIQSVDYWRQRRTEDLIYPLAMRFPGLSVERPTSWSSYMDEGIKGADWLTILSDHFLEKLGGKDELKGKLGEEFPFYDYEGGAMIQAGPYPQIGDMNRKNIPTHYQKLGRTIKPIRVDYGEKYFIKVPKGVDGMEKTKEWFARFD